MSRTTRSRGDLKSPSAGPRDPVPGTSHRVRKPGVLLGPQRRIGKPRPGRVGPSAPECHDRGVGAAAPDAEVVSLIHRTCRRRRGR